MEDGLGKRPRTDDPPPNSSLDDISPSKRSRIVIVPANGGGRPSPSAPERDAAPNQISSRKSALTTNDSEEDDDDYTSSSGSDSDSDEDGEDAASVDYTSDQASGAHSSLPHVSARQKPRIRRIGENPDILARLSSFLPQMKSANEDLQREIAAGRGKDLQLDEVDEGDGAQYIEMNLGLGVLEEKRADGSNSTDEEIEDSPDSANDAGATDGQSAEVHKDSAILDKLMGKKKSSTDQKPTIQDLSGPQPT